MVILTFAAQLVHFRPWRIALFCIVQPLLKWCHARSWPMIPHVDGREGHSFHGLLGEPMLIEIVQYFMPKGIQSKIEGTLTCGPTAAYFSCPTEPPFTGIPLRLDRVMTLRMTGALGLQQVHYAQYPSARASACMRRGMA